MKKILFLISIVLVAFTSCTTQSEDQALLQKQYKVVYYLDNETNRYICIDTAMNVFDVRVDMGGIPYAIFKINQ